MNVGPLKPPRKKRNFIVVNDIEIELDDDDDEEKEEEDVAFFHDSIVIISFSILFV